MKKQKELYKILRPIAYVVITAAVYFLLDMMIQLTGVLRFGPLVGLKNFLPATFGLFWYFYGVAGACIGAVATGIVMQNPSQYILAECLCSIVLGMGVTIAVHMLSDSHRVTFKRVRHYTRYISYLFVLCFICYFILLALVSHEEALAAVTAYFFMSVLVGIPINILFSSLLCVEVVAPKKYRPRPDTSVNIDSDPMSLALANEEIEMNALARRQSMKRIFEVENCIEEMVVRIIKNHPDAIIHVEAHYSDSISLRIRYSGPLYNPFKKREDEDEMDIAGLNLLRHRALRASARYHHFDGINNIHIVL